MKENRKFIDCVITSLKGFCKAFKIEKNIRRYIVIFLVSSLINIIVHISFIKWLIFLVIAWTTISAELLNTAIEKLCDYLTESYNDKIGNIKDIASAGVMVVGFTFIIVEVLIVVSTLCMK